MLGDLQYLEVKVRMNAFYSHGVLDEAIIFLELQSVFQ